MGKKERQIRFKSINSRFSHSFSSFFLFLLFFLCLISYSSATQLSSDLDCGFFRFIQGKVEILSVEGNNEKRIQAYVGMKVYPGDILISSEDSSALLSMNNKGTVHLYPKSEILIQRNSPRKVAKKKSNLPILIANYSIYLFIGKIRSRIKSLTSNKKRNLMRVHKISTSSKKRNIPIWTHQISTPSAVIGVRGTDIIVAHTDEYGGNPLITKITSVTGTIDALTSSAYNNNIPRIKQITDGKQVQIISKPANDSQSIRLIKLSNEERENIQNETPLIGTEGSKNLTTGITSLISKNDRNIPEKGHEIFFSNLNEIFEPSYNEESLKPSQIQAQVQNQPQRNLLHEEFTPNSFGCNNPNCRPVIPQSIPPSNQRATLHIRVVHEN